MASVSLSLPLAAPCKRLITFLHALNACPLLLAADSAVVKRAIYRYEHCWLPLLNETQTEAERRGSHGEEEGTRGESSSGSGTMAPFRLPLLPPIDVMWVWYCHRLSPAAYSSDCEVLFGRVVDNGEEWGEEEAEAWDTRAAHESRRIWNLKYPFDAYDADVNFGPPGLELAGLRVAEGEEEGGGEGREESGIGGGDEEGKGRGGSKSKLKFDFEAAIAREALFLHQVAPPYLLDSHLLAVSEQRYRSFLHLMQKALAQGVAHPLFPTIDIRLMWRTHLLFPIAYSTDSLRLLGSTPTEDPLLLSPSFNSSPKLHDRYRATARLWEETFGTPYLRAGSVFCGPPPEPVSLPPPQALTKSKSGMGSRGDSGSTSGSGSMGSGIRSVSSSQSASPRSSPSASPQQEGGGRQKAAQSRRQIVQVLISIRGIINLSLSKGDVFLSLSPLAHCSSLSLQTPKQPAAATVSWKCQWCLSAELASQGLLLQLWVEVGGMLKRSVKVLGEVVLKWGDILVSPDLAVNGPLPLVISKGSDLKPLAGKPPSLLLHASITPPTPADLLLLFSPSPPTDDSSNQLCSAFSAATKKQQEGRWISRTIVDHAGGEQFVLRVRSHKGKGSSLVEVAADGKRISLHKGGWTQKIRNVPCAGERITELWQLKSSKMDSQRTWQAAAGWSITIKLHPSFPSSPNRLILSTNKIQGDTIALLHGRLLQFQAPPSAPIGPGSEIRPSSSAPTGAAGGKKGEKQGGVQHNSGSKSGDGDNDDDNAYVTVVRFDSTLTRSRATALFNWKTGAVQVSSEEQVETVLLICFAIAQSWHDLVSKFRKTSAKPLKRTLPPNGDHYGSIVVHGSLLDMSSCNPPLMDWYRYHVLMCNDQPVYSAPESAVHCGVPCGGTGCGSL